jgi:hypothetical protein
MRTMPQETKYTALKPEIITKLPSSIRSSSRALYTRWFEDGWGTEVLGAILGAAMTIILCVLLFKYDGQPVPSFGSVLNTSITLNTVVSILLSVSIPSLLLPVSGAIGQLMWIWFATHSRPIQDVETFSQGGRGALGGARLIWNLCSR